MLAKLQKIMGLIPSIILIVLIILPLVTVPAYSVGISELNIIIIYDPTVDYGIVVYTLKLDTVLNDLSMIRILLIGGNNINIVSVTNGQGEELLYKYDELTNEIEIIANNTDLINITYEVNGLFQEIGVGAYISYIDLSPYSDINTKAEIDLLGRYNIYAEPDNINILQGRAITIIMLNTPTQYVIIAEETIPTNTSTTTTLSRTETTTEKTSSATTTTMTSEESHATSITTSRTKETSIEKTISEQTTITTTTNIVETYKTTQQTEITSTNTTMWLLAIIVLLIIIGIVVAVKKK